MRSVHCTAGRRVADGGDPKGVGDLLTQGHLHPASSPGVNLTPARPLVDRPGHLSFWPECPILNLQKEEGAKSAGSRRGPRGRGAPLGSGLGIVYSSSASLFSLQHRHWPGALGRPPHLSPGSRRIEGGDFRTPLLTSPADDSPGFQALLLRRAGRGPPWVTTLSPAII